MTVDSISPPQIADEVIQSAGEDLGELLGRVLETKMLVSRAVRGVSRSDTNRSNQCLGLC
jgi:hypothetical protein